MPAARPSKRANTSRFGPGRIAVVAVGAVALAAIVAVAIGVMASGDDDGSGAAPAAPVDRAAFCGVWGKITPLVVEEALADDDGDNKLRAGKMLDLLTAGGTPPAEVADAATYLRQAFRQAEAGDRRRYDAPDRQLATNDILAWVYRSCGFNQVQVTYRDFTYDGIPATLPAGSAAFEGIQAGDEPHVMQVYRIRDGVPGTPEEVLARSRVAPIPSVALARSAELVGFGAFTDFDGDPGYLTLDLAPGSYLVICPVPTGVNRDGVAPDRTQPHFDHGQVASFTVE
jgi:hypothetical protein